MASVIVLKDVRKSYRSGKVVTHAVRGVDLTVKSGEFAALSGPSGSGKTTLLNLIGCMDTVTGGSVTVNGHTLDSMSDRARTRFRLENLGFVFQSFNLVPVLTAYQNVELPLLLRGHLRRGEREKRILELFDDVGLADQTNKRPSEMSGGQQQRVAIARALVTRPSLVLADEPTGNLDSATGDTVLEVMRNLNRSLRTTFVFSTHDERAMEVADRRIRLQDGALI